MRVKGDQLFLVGAVLIFGGVSAWVFILDADVGEPAREGIPLGGASFEIESLPEEPVAEVQWDAPTSQSEDGRWIYDLFTPPKIYINPETNLFSVIPYTGPREEAPFGIELVRVERPLYRLSFEGYIEENPRDSRRSLIRLYNRETERLELVQVGDTPAGGDYRVDDFRLEREIGDNGLLETRAQLEIEDLRIGRQIVLEVGETRYADAFRLVFAGEDPDGENRTYIIESEGESFDHAGGRFTVRSIDFDTGMVRIEKEEAGPETTRTTTEIFTFETQTARRTERDRFDTGTFQPGTTT